MEHRNADFYQTLRRRVQLWLAQKGRRYTYADYLLFAPDLFHLLTKLVLDKRVPTDQKVKLAAAITYFISPLDLVPEGILGPAGYMDDMALAAYVISGLINAGHGAIAQEHWAGDGDLLKLIQRTLKVADSALGSGMWKRVQGIVKGDRMSG